jgi:N-acyl-D-amino-acid deacylase
MSAPFDLIVRNGSVLDGTGAPAVRADVGVRGDRIAAVGDLAAASAARIIDVAGAVVCPGFIDAHTHSDTFLLIEPDAPSKLTQGVTTEICGQCGGSGAPVVPNRTRLPADWTALAYPELRGARNAERGMRSSACVRPGDNATPSSTPRSALRTPHSGPTWTTVAEYGELLAQVQPAVNVVLFIGHNTIRKAVMGYEPRTATVDEVAAMARLLDQALEEGGSGLSTGLIYQPGKYAAPEEILALARVASRRGARYATHMRSEGDRLLESIDEVLGLAREAGVQVQISHLKTSGASNWDKLESAIERIERARGTGLVVHADRYPYLAGGTDLDVVLPDWASAGGRDGILKNLADPATRDRVIAALDAMDRDWSGVMIGGARHPAVASYTGQTVTEVAAARGSSPGAALVWMIATDETRTEAFFFGLCERNLRRIYAQPWVMVGSDASARAPTGPLADSHPHPRAYGAFPRFLRLVQDEKLMPLPEAIRRCTSLPADAFGLPGRGRLAVGAFADLVVFEPSAIRDHATYARPHQFATGVGLVVVNGRLSYEGGRFTGHRGGRLLQAAPVACIIS